MHGLFYLGAITVGLCLCYVFLEHVFNLFFEKHLPHLSKRSFISVGIILVASIFSYFITWLIPDPQLANRTLHMLGGGFLAIMVCFLVVKDSRIHITRFQFFVFSFFVVTALGVGNELLEFFLQHYFGLTFSTYVTDTWLDLASNMAGIVLGSISFTPFIKPVTLSSL